MFNLNWKFVKCPPMCLAFVGLFLFLFLATSNHYKDSYLKERFQPEVELTVISNLENDVASYETGICRFYSNYQFYFSHKLTFKSW